MKNLTTNKTNGVAGGKMRKGFTLIEIIFVVVIIGILAGLTIPKIVENSRMTEAASAFQNESKTLYQGLKQYVNEDPNYQSTKTINAFDLSAYFPTAVTVEQDPNDASITDYTDTNYPNLKYTIVPNADGSFNFKIYVTKLASGNDNLAVKLSQKASQILNKYCAKSDGATEGTADGEYYGMVDNCFLK